MGDNSIYPYKVQDAPAILFAVIFTLSTALFCLQVRTYRSWRIGLFLCWAGLLYTAGFVVRVVSGHYPDNLGLYISSIVMLYCAPPVYAAANYFILGRTLHYIPYLSVIHPGRVITTFLGLDIIIEVITAQGASRVAQYDNKNQVKIGLNLIRASLLLQIALFLGFIALQANFHLRARRAGVCTRRLKATMMVLYTSNALILARSIFRAVENFIGTDSYLQRHEWPLYVFDALPMLFNALVLNFFYPAAILPKSDKIYLTPDGATERMGPGWKDQRPFLVTLVDPFDCVGLCRGRDSKERFWDEAAEHPIATAEQRSNIIAVGADGKRPLLTKIVDPINVNGYLSPKQDEEKDGNAYTSA